MLFTDGNFVSSTDLVAWDPEVTAAAKAESIVIDSSQGSIITRAMTDMMSTVTARTQNFSGYYVGIGYTAAHEAAVRNTGSASINSPKARLSQIVAVSPDPSKRQFLLWGTMFTLQAFYRSAFHRKDNDRYEKKMTMYKSEQDRAWANLKYMGLPIVYAPLSCPGATFEPGSGTWGDANLSSAGSSVQVGSVTYYVAITWVNSANYVSPSNTNRGESAGSTLGAVTILANQAVSVNITSLNPPTGSLANVGIADGVYSPQPATGWNVYVGTKRDQLWLQNATPIAVATKTYTLAAAPTLSGYPLTAGQWENVNYALTDGVLWRA